jgi:hypothetical protein
MSAGKCGVEQIDDCGVTLITGRPYVLLEARQSEESVNRGGRQDRKRMRHPSETKPRMLRTRRASIGTFMIAPLHSLILNVAVCVVSSLHLYASSLFNELSWSSQQAEAYSGTTMSKAVQSILIAHDAHPNHRVPSFCVPSSEGRNTLSITV